MSEFFHSNLFSYLFTAIVAVLLYIALQRDRTTFNWLRSSFEEKRGHASGKALTAFAITLCYCYAHTQMIPLPTEMVWADVTLIAALYGVKVLSQRYGGANGDQAPEERTSPEEKKKDSLV